ncbi:hypothetical protein PHYPSEUDO_004085 [Phytophthora pseudosyringae]|uniref:Tyrosinase copper-binding domain-containing protein n=1 Tax=Phytophthora pseudosyringae TaxID=221518 RepID=A0A8T1VP30_9STRA|nr:hypothetical protein PHYPSEUDO_004085 [Phytophthora pseudosyringae]
MYSHGHSPSFLPSGRSCHFFGKMLRAAVVCLVISTLLLPASGQQAGTSCTQPRVRKSWDAYNDTEKTLYKEAVGAAMTQGFHQKFVQIHTTYANALEAHKTCMFVYWHRMLLLGYENMLRSLHSSYACVTLPYWDHVSGSALQAASSCSTIETCSPIIADFGGTTGLAKSLVVYNASITYTAKTTCVNQGLAGRFCGNNTGCAYCIMRTRSKYMGSYPADAYFGSVYQQVFTYSEWDKVSSAIENGVHNSVHNALGGMMAYTQAPVDPVFYSHHALIDLLQTIYLKCQLGDAKTYLSAAGKASDPRFWSSCAKAGGGTFSGTDTITMRVTSANDSKTFVNVWQDANNMLYPFFKDLPYTYGDYIDAKDLGSYSYTYEIGGGLANMYQNCSASNALTTSAGASAALLASGKQGTVVKNAVLKRGKEPLSPTIAESTEEDDATRRWSIALFETAKMFGLEDWAAREQVETITCLHHAECIGPVEDYSYLYRENFGIEGHTRCFSIIGDLVAGTRVIAVPRWREITRRFLPCPRRDGVDAEEE